MISFWEVLTVFGFAVMFLLAGLIILFVVSAIYHKMIKHDKTPKESAAGIHPGPWSKAA